MSEETGTISVAENGHIMRHLDTETLKAILEPAFSSPKQGLREMWENWRHKK